MSHRAAGQLAKGWSRRLPSAIAALWGMYLLLAPASCRRERSAESEKPVDVTSVIVQCQTAEECTQQCLSGQATACVTAGHFYEYGRGVPADPTRAFHLYERACALSYAGGCYNAAVLLEAGRGASKDLRRARELYAKVCEMGSKTACERAEALAEGGGP